MLNMDFTTRVVIDTDSQQWVASPAAGVWRKPLAREDAERGHATSVVRYDAGASFRAHNHPGGEEILVLQGTFSDETGDYGAGTYFRNPIGFRHAPFSREGCVLLVKLHQFQPDDENHVIVDTLDAGLYADSDGVSSLSLHTHGDERVQLVRAQAHAELPAAQELFIIDGELLDDAATYSKGTWLRDPAPGPLRAGANGATVWMKAGHLHGANAH